MPTKKRNIEKSTKHLLNHCICLSNVMPGNVQISFQELNFYQWQFHCSLNYLVLTFASQDKRQPVKDEAVANLTDYVSYHISSSTLSSFVHTVDTDVWMIDQFWVISQWLSHISLLLHFITLILPLWPTFPLLPSSPGTQGASCCTPTYTHTSQENYLYCPGLGPV